MAKGAAQRYPVYTTGQGQRRRRSRPDLSNTSCAMADDVLVEADTNAGMLQPVPGQRFGQYGPLGGENPVGFTPNGVSDTLEPAEPVTANPGTGELRRLAQQAQRRHRLRGGHRRRLRPRGGQRVAGVPAVRARPETHAGDGQLRREHRCRQGHLGVVPAAATHAGPAAGDRRRRGSDLVLRRGRRVQLRPVAQTAVGRAPARRQLTRRWARSSRSTSSPRRPGATCVSRWRGRRRRPTSRASSPTTRTCPPTSGSRSPRRGCRCCETAQQFLGSQTPVLMDIATAANFPCQRPFSEHLGVAELPRVPHPAELQAGGGVVEPVAVRRGRRAVPVHPGAAAHLDGPDLSARRLVPRLGLHRALRPRGAASRRRPTPSSTRARMRVFGWSRNGPIRALP